MLGNLMARSLEVMNLSEMFEIIFEKSPYHETFSKQFLHLLLELLAESVLTLWLPDFYQKIPFLTV